MNQSIFKTFYVPENEKQQWIDFLFKVGIAVIAIEALILMALGGEPI